MLIFAHREQTFYKCGYKLDSELVVPMNLRDLKKFADALDEASKQELIFFLQSRTNGFMEPVRAIDDQTVKSVLRVYITFRT